MGVEPKSDSSSELTMEFTKESPTTAVTSDEAKLLRDPETPMLPTARVAQAPVSSSWFDPRSFTNPQWASNVSHTVSDAINYIAGQFSEETLGLAEEEKRRSEAIDQFLDQESHRRDRQLKVIMFGDIWQKQILWRHSRLIVQPLSSQERSELVPEVRRAVLDMAMTVLHYLDEEIISKMKEKNLEEDWTRKIRAIRSLHWKDETERVNQILALNIETFHAQLEHHGVSMKEVYSKAHFFDEPGFLGCPYYDSQDIFKQVERVYATDYEPTDHDFFHFDRRLSLTLIREVRIEKIGYSIQLQDPVRNMGERRKWIHHMENPTGLLFIADISHYDEVLLEDDSSNVLDEQMVAYESVLSSKWFFKAPLLLVLSNVVLFESKLEISPLAKTFPDYEGTSLDDAKAYIASRFLSRAKDRTDIHVVYLNVCDEQSVRELLDVMEGTVLKPALAKLGVIA
ncbi:unnamed protein product [Clonostachys rhizophaga]|uniref:Uncharacterized protein n=1 Tax=Clonostachys rhizophaga TaxID=160324 RepID=A0A9N9VXK1_9HYPO|nr:unnamed protein product [Clonostachys rhizophaga]